MKYLILLAIALVSLTVPSCKKGEDDPFLSLRSRKARIVGEWEMTHYRYEYQAEKTDPVFAVESDGVRFWQSSGGVNFYTGYLSETARFNKNGTYKWTSTSDGKYEESEGSWNFTSGVGDVKNKSQLVLLPESEKMDIWDLTELRHKKIRVKHRDEWDSGYQSEEYVFEAK